MKLLFFLKQSLHDCLNRTGTYPPKRGTERTLCFESG